MTLPANDLAGNTAGFGDDYSTSPCYFGYYIGGDDLVYSFTLDEDSFVEGSIAGDGSSTGSPYLGFHITSDCVDVATECAAEAHGSQGGTLGQTVLSAGTYYLTISTWPSPQNAGFILNLSASAIVEGCMDCLLYTSPSPRDRTRSRMPSSA